MGTRGPVGYSAKVHQLRGTVPHALRGGVKAAPLKLRPSAPEPPPWLDSEAEAEWQRVVSTLDAQGLLSPVDRAIVASYCSAWSVLVKAVAELDNAGSLTFQGARGATKSAEFRVWKDAVAMLGMLAGKILCTPTDRLRLHLPTMPDTHADDILD